MVEIKTIGISSLVALGIVLTSILVPGFFDEPKYFCESRPDIGLVNCDSFTKYVDSNGKCIRNEDTNLICKDGWKQVFDDTIIPEEIESTIESKIIVNNIIITYKDLEGQTMNEITESIMLLNKQIKKDKDDKYECVNSECCVIGKDKIKSRKCINIKSKVIKLD